MFGQHKDFDQPIKLASRDPEDIGGACAANQLYQLVGNHFLFARIPLFALPME